MTVGTKTVNNNILQIELLIGAREETIHKAKTECSNKALPLLLKEFETEKVQDLTHIYVLGYTPEWNDGEECEHRTCVYIENDRANHKYTNVIEYHERFDYDLDYDNPPSHLLDINAGISREKARNLEEAFSKKYSNILEEVLGTNWKLEIEFLENGEVKITHGDYDCGY